MAITGVSNYSSVYENTYASSRKEAAKKEETKETAAAQRSTETTKSSSNNMKRYIGMLLTLVCVIVLNACGKKDVSETETNSGMECTVEDIADLFTENGYSVKSESVEQQILSGQRYRIVLDGDLDKQIVVYVYGNSEEAAIDAGYIGESGEYVLVTDGETATKTDIEWTSVPHYYLHDNMILQYVGLNENILKLLSEFCGEQFAGGSVESVE